MLRELFNSFISHEVVSASEDLDHLFVDELGVLVDCACFNVDFVEGLVENEVAGGFPNHEVVLEVELRDAEGSFDYLEVLEFLVVVEYQQSNGFRTVSHYRDGMPMPAFQVLDFSLKL